MQDSEEEREVNLRKMAEMYEDSPYKGYLLGYMIMHR